MDALPYVDTMVKEYLLFRGFTRTLDAFNAGKRRRHSWCTPLSATADLANAAAGCRPPELAEDKSCGFQAEQITCYIFQTLIPELRMHELMEFLEFLNARCGARWLLTPTLRRSAHDRRQAAAQPPLPPHPHPPPGPLARACRFYSRLDSRYEAAIRKMETSIVRLLLVSAFRASRPEQLQEFFSCYGDGLLAGPDGAGWRSWFALMYVKQPQQDAAKVPPQNS